MGIDKELSRLSKIQRDAMAAGVEAQCKIIKLESICGYNIDTLINMLLAGYELKKESEENV